MREKRNNLGQFSHRNKGRDQMHKIFRVFAVAITLLAVSFETADAAPKKDKYLYLMGSTPQGTAPIVVAVKNGYCKKAGLDIDMKMFTSGGVAAQAFIGGQGDWVVTGDWPAIRTWITTKANPDPIVGLFPAAHYADLSVVVSKSSIKKAADFKGKTMGVWLGTTSEFFAAKYLDSNGVPLKDVTYKNIKPAEMVVALDRGDIDGFTIWQPFGWRAEEVSGNKVHILSTGKGFFTEYMVTSTRKSLLKNDPDAVSAMIKCTQQGADYVSSNPDEAAKIVGAQFKIPADKVKQMLVVQNFDPTYNAPFRKAMDELNAFMISKGKSTEAVNWSKEFDTSGLHSVSGSLVK
jgi:ABC-type nitrate/sulfonate/bicarbonate transport system substrate-binding protein